MYIYIYIGSTFHRFYFRELQVESRNLDGHQPHGPYLCCGRCKAYGGGRGAVAAGAVSRGLGDEIYNRISCECAGEKTYTPSTTGAACATSGAWRA